jgi:predicted enzyme related to lactoylglutathione lyase
MTTNPSYAPGVPMWVDLSSTDLGGATAFYTGLFGWDAEDMGEEAGHYTMMRKDGKTVAAVGPVMNPGQPSAWTTYVATQDANASATKVREAGGQVAMDAFDVMDAGRMAVFQDPSGAFISVWEPKNHKGAELVNEPGSLAWNELQSRDIDAAKLFYPKVFGWGIKDNPMGPGMTYTEWQVDGRSIAGGMAMMPGAPARVPSNWLVYFAVADVDDAVAKAEASGGRVLMPRSESPAGPFAVISDPQGAAFAVIQVS